MRGAKTTILSHLTCMMSHFPLLVCRPFQHRPKATQVSSGTGCSKNNSQYIQTTTIYFLNSLQQISLPMQLKCQFWLILNLLSKHANKVSPFLYMQNKHLHSAYIKLPHMRICSFEHLFKFYYCQGFNWDSAVPELEPGSWRRLCALRRCIPPQPKILTRLDVPYCGLRRGRQ